MDMKTQQKLYETGLVGSAGGPTYMIGAEINRFLCRIVSTYHPLFNNVRMTGFFSGSRLFQCKFWTIRFTERSEKNTYGNFRICCSRFLRICSYDFHPYFLLMGGDALSIKTAWDPYRIYGVKQYNLNIK